MPISQDTLDRLPAHARGDMREIAERLRAMHSTSHLHEPFVAMLDAFADMVRDHRTAEQHRRDLFAMSALAGLSGRQLNSAEMAALAVRVGDETIFNLDAPDALTVMKQTIALLQAENERLTAELKRVGADVAGYEYAHEETIPEAASPRMTRYRLEQLVLIARTHDDGLRASAVDDLRRDLGALFAKTRAGNEPLDVAAALERQDAK